MEHDKEKWQLYSQNGAAVVGQSYDTKVNPPEGAKEYVAASDVWLYRRTESGVELLFQKRSHYVDRNPDLWDVSTCGHVNFGETPVLAAEREAREEIGAKINKDKLEYVFSVLSTNGSNIVNHYFLYDYTGEDDDFAFNDREVSEVRWVPFEQFDEFIEKFAKPPLKNARFTRELTKLFISRVCRDEE